MENILATLAFQTLRYLHIDIYFDIYWQIIFINLSFTSQTSEPDQVPLPSFFSIRSLDAFLYVQQSTKTCSLLSCTLSRDAMKTIPAYLYHKPHLNWSHMRPNGNTKQAWSERNTAAGATRGWPFSDEHWGLAIKHVNLAPPCLIQLQRGLVVANTNCTGKGDGDDVIQIYPNIPLCQSYY